MSLSKICLNNNLRLTALSLAMTLAACSSNPATDTAASQPAPVETSAQQAAPSGNSSQATAYQPVLTKVSEPVPLAEGHPNEYVVQVGDTLWDIAATFLKDPWYWPEIWYVNPDIVNPHLIYPGDVLALVYIDGQPRITNVRASTYRLSPQARVTPLDQAVVSIPYETVAAFLTSGYILEKKQADSLPYFLSARGDHLIASAGNEIYVRGLTQDTSGTPYNVVHIGDELRDPDDNRLVGYQGLPVAEGRLLRGGDPATVQLISSSQEAVPGDRLLPDTVDVPLNFYPSAPSAKIDGSIMAVVGGVSQIGQYQVVVMNRGTQDGLAVGDVLTVFQAGDKIKDRFGGGKVTLPEEEAGTVMVFKTYDRISYGLIMEATNALHVLDKVRNPT
jgi:LysM repeat protein